MKRKLFILTISLAAILAACDKTLEDFVNPAQDDGYRTYTIKKGEQYSYSLTSKFKDTEMKFKVIFDNSAIYSTADPGNQIDINKLYGFSDCGKDHHTASARFGWRWSNDSLRLFAYCYKDAVMTFKELSTVEIGKEHDCSILISDTNYIFTLNGKVDTMARGCDVTTGVRTRLFPFFGGDEMAPHDVNIKIKETSK
ncbi:MAG: hypothetical protein K1X81_09880 [Bacteroidia bacterium]|nr:hypothetical protein [Bacteroidia bacterium]